MKNLLVLLFLSYGLFTSGQIKGYKPGSVVTDFTLKNVDNKAVSLKDYKNIKGYIIIFISNTCPYSKAYENRIIDLHNKYAAKGFPVIAINPNDPIISKGDNFEAMQEQARVKQYPFAYLYDPGQTVTNSFGADRTPYAFLISKSDKGDTVEYVGAIDNDTENTNPDKVKYLENAVDALLAGRKPTVTYTKAIGCTVARSKKQS